MKNRLLYETIPDGSNWMSNLAVELLDIRNGDCNLTGFSKEEIEILLCYACTS